MLSPYLGYGTAERLWLMGRVLEDEGFVPSTDADTAWQNLVAMYRRFETDEVPGARVRARFGGAETETVADAEGYFRLEVDAAGALDPGPWQEVGLELLDPEPPDGEAVRASTRVLVPPATATFGVISDVDDTVVASNVRNRLKMILTVALSNEHTRVPFKGVAAFYQALVRGASGADQNPIFYVSSSPWNLYDPLVAFFELQEIPAGPLFLKDFGDHTLFSSRDHHTHKLGAIARVLETYPHLPFVLIGDSGEQDPEIYREAVARYPDRIRVIYIRSVDPDPLRLEAIDGLIEEVQKTGSQLVLTPDSEFAAVHAAAEGLIEAGELASIRHEKRRDIEAPGPDEVLGEEE